MTRRSKVLLLAGLALSLAGNLFQLLWGRAEDSVVRLSRAEIAAKIEEFGRTPQSSARWSRVWIETPELVILETGDMVNFRGLFGAHAKRAIYIASE